MIFELAGSRLLAPQFGTSIIVWTNLIGVILGSLSLGYYLGGRLADRNPSLKHLSLLVLLSAFFVFVPFVFRDIFISFVSGAIPDLRFGALVVSVFLFAPGSIFLGAVNPYAVKLRLNKLEEGGAVVGKMSAWGTLGSIAGTFLAGFLLVPFFGTANLIWFIVFTLFVISMSLGGVYFFKTKTAILLLLLFFAWFDPFMSPNPYLLAKIETRYNSITVEEGRLSLKNEGRLRTLATDPYGVHGACLADNCGRLVFQILQAFRLGIFFQPEAESALMFGGGTYSFPKEFSRENPGLRLDVVEIDPGFTRVAEQYFEWENPGNVRIFHEDGRTFLNRAREESYQIVFMDAFNSQVSIPFHLTTKETAEKLFRVLDSEGIVLINLISSLSGESAGFFEAEYATYSAVFPFVYVFPVQSRDLDKVQNILLVASKQALDFSRPEERVKSIISHRYEGEVKPGLVLTDDYAPVEYLSLKMLKAL